MASTRACHGFLRYWRAAVLPCARVIREDYLRLAATFFATGFFAAAAIDTRTGLALPPASELTEAVNSSTRLVSAWIHTT